MQDIQKLQRKHHTRVFVGVDVVEVVGLLGELHLSIAVAKLLHKEGVVLPHNLPDQIPRNGCHFPSPKQSI